MSDALLDPEELEAIQDAIRETAPRRSSQTPDVEPTRLALIADDRSVETVRPVLINLATRWVRRGSKLLKQHLSGQWQLDVIGAESIDGPTAKEELRGSWLAGGKAGAAEAVFAVVGPVIDIAAARRCGGVADANPDTTRAPSPISIRLFQPIGRQLFETWCAQWQEAFDAELQPSTELGIVQRLIEANTVVRVTIAFSGSLAGKVVVFVRPEVLLPKPAALAAVKAKALSVANALSNVPVDIVVELGTLRLPLNQIRKLERGATHALPKFVDSRVPVYCGGVLKAWGKPVVSRGVLAVQIISVVHGQGTQS
ncbi:MAG TPA: FliM/FliN family flagellar motor C-terminal domain-containing protein [Kofleriaceae bacterium]